MKDFIKFFSIITGLFRSIISILLLFAIGFIVFVDTNLLLATFDLVGITSISAAFIKPLTLAITIIAFVVNTGITRNIFKAGRDGKGHLANLFFGLLFLGIDVFLFFYLREKLLYILIGFNGLLVLNSLLGLIGNFRGIYEGKKEVEKKTEYIEVKTGASNPTYEENPIKLNFKGEAEEEVNIIKKDDTEVEGESVIRTSQLIEKDTDLTDNEEDYQVKDEIDESKNPKEDKEIEDINKDDIKTANDPIDRIEIEDDNTEIIENEDTSSKKIESENDLIEEIENQDDSIEKNENKKVNKLVEKRVNTDQTYDPDLAEDFKKKEDAKIYDKSKFIKEDD